MSYQFYNDDTVCRKVEPLLSDYLENALSAREVWEVEKHLTACPACTQLSQQMQATVHVLRSADRYDTGDDFMAKLHARLDDLEPEPARSRSLGDMAQNWLVSLRAGMHTWHVPALATGFAAATLFLVVHGNLSIGPPKAVVPLVAERVVQNEDLSRQVAFVASNPFDDPVAAKAEVDGANSDSHTDNSGPTANF
ncbi:MAG: putative zinc-finger [Chthonomonadaceae bacterium]|nr:putative zinc-finger [Chthonomonadaceae bacterium]